MAYNRGMFDPPFDISHLHKGEQDRIKRGDLTPDEQGMLARNEDPWAKFRGPEKPKTKGTELSKLINVFESEAETSKQPPEVTLDFLKKQQREIREALEGLSEGRSAAQALKDSIEKLGNELHDPLASFHEMSRQREENQGRFDEILGDAAENVELPPVFGSDETGEFHRDPTTGRFSIRHQDDVPPPAQIDYKKQERRNRREIEKAVERALKNHENHARSQSQIGAFFEQSGFVPVRPFIPPDYPTKPDSPPKNPVKQKIIGLVEAFAGVGIAMGGSTIESPVVSFFVLSCGLALITAAIWKLNFLEAKSVKTQRFFNTVSSCIGAVLLFVLWVQTRPVQKPVPLTRKELQEELERLKPPQSTQPAPAIMPSPLASTSPLSQPRTQRTAEVIRGTAILSIGGGPDGEAKATVRTTLVRAKSTIVVTGKENSVSGTLRVGNIKPGVSFDILSNNGGDEGKVFWVMYP